MNLLLLNQYFPPDRAATSILLGQWVEDLSLHHNITIVCGQPTYDPEAISPTWRPNVRIYRAPLLPFSRSNIVVRLLNYILFLIYAFGRSLSLPKHDFVTCWTDPPLIGAIAATTKRIKGGKLIVVFQDLYPEVLIGMDKFNFRPILIALKWISTWVIRTADRVVAIGNDMAKRLYAKGATIDQVAVIPNWQDLDHLKPDESGAFRSELQIPSTSFVVMHSGNVGLSQDFESFLNAAHETANDSTILYIIIGSGQRRAELEQEGARRNITNLRFLPYQPASRLAESLSAADVHYVSLTPSLTGAIVPSKIYGVLAVGRAVVANVSAESEIARIMNEAECGLLLPPDGKTIAAAIRELAADRERTKRMGIQGRRWVEKNGGRPRAMLAYNDLISKCA